MYNAPARDIRPFPADYPPGHIGIPNDGQASAALTHDIDNRPLTVPPEFIAGRRVVGGGDEPISPPDYERLTQALVGKKVELAGPEVMGSDWGHVLPNKLETRPVALRINKRATPEQVEKIWPHELGHAIDLHAGKMPTIGLVKEEFQPLFNTMNNPNRAKGGLEAAAPWGKQVTPKAQGYEGAEIPREYVAEAFRAYITNPNYIKSVAPRVAVRIRESVNAH